MRNNKFSASLLLAVVLAWTSHAQAFSGGDVLILDGLQIDAANPLTFVFDKTSPALTTEIKFDFVYEAGGDSGVSWGSELGITITAPNGAQWNLGSEGNWCAGCDFDFGFIDAPGLYVMGGSIDLGGLDYGLGFWEITIGESFDDSGIDGRFLSGAIGINKTPVPVPAALWLFASGLMGLGVLRRRTA